MHTKLELRVVQTEEESTETPVASGTQYMRRFPGPTQRCRPKIEENTGCPRMRREERVLAIWLARSYLEHFHDSMQCGQHFSSVNMVISSKD